MTRTIHNPRVTPSPQTPSQRSVETIVVRDEDENGSLVRLRVYGRNETTESYMDFAPYDDTLEPPLIGSSELTQEQQAQSSLLP